MIIVVIGACQDVLLINRKGCEILGYETDEIIGRNWFDNFLPGRNINETKSVFGKLMSGEVGPVEYYENPVLTKGGDERIIAWHNTVFRDNGIGMPEDVDYKNTDSLGMRLVKALAENQLQGAMELIRGEGTCFRIRFREEEYAQRV
ncbi:MAG: PAS domain S-box protein [Nitrospirae bacterium]|nr:PAS domain S-box protein [Nitrospirota bacterium]